MNKGEKAKALFLSGHNCAQAVLCAFCAEIGMDEKSALALSACFGGGLGRQREVCGAVSGMCMAFSALHAPKDPTNHAQKAAFYAQIQELCARFKKENGSIICRELLALPAGPSTPVPQPRTSAYYQNRPCPDKVKSAAAILENYFAEFSSKTSAK